jgi:threonine aldolase
MRQAMAEAEVGDDVLDGDPTTRRLEDRVAALLGMDGALFFPSGTQANQAGVALVTEPGTELILEAQAHLVHFELAGVALISGVQIRPVATPDGLLDAGGVRAALRPASPHLPRVSAVAVENTHNAAGGRVLSRAALEGIVAVVREAGLALHIDGARIWNAAAALQVPVDRLTVGAATVMVSFSKGLGCPVGSCLAWRGDHRARVWEIRKRLGGGMRQSGILAAAALWALQHTAPRLAEDHANARVLAERLRSGAAVRVQPPETNIVMIDLARESDTAEGVAARLGRAGLLVAPFGQRRLRAVTHQDVARADVERAADVMAEVLA